MTSPVLGFEELADQLALAGLALSPDGHNLVITVTARSKKREKAQIDLWLSRNGAPAFRFTGGESADHSPAWKPDGTTIAFLSDRGEGDDLGIYLLPIDGGEAQRLGEFEGALSTPKWSPDGTRLAVLCTDAPSEADKKRKKDRDDPEVYEAENPRSRLCLVDVESGSARCLTHGSRHVIDYAWHPAGDALVAIALPQATINARFGPSELIAVPVAGGLSRLIAEFLPAPGSPVVRTTDAGTVVAVVASTLRDDPARTVWTVPYDGGGPATLMPDYEGVVESIVADPRSADGLLVHVVEDTHGKVCTLSIAGGAINQVEFPGLPEGGSIVSEPTISNDGQSLAVLWSRSDVATEAWFASNGSEAVPVTSFGKGFEGRLQRGEDVSWTSVDGTEIHGVLVYPRDYDPARRYPLFVQIHGGPTWQWEDRANLSWHDWGQMLASRGYAVLLPNPRGSTGRGSDFERLLINDVGGGECDDIISGARAMVERGIADPDRLAIGGWSWGGYLTGRAITQTDIFKAAIFGAGVSNLVSDHGAGDIAEANMAFYTDHPYREWDLYADRSPIRHAAKITTPTLILHGGADTRVHPAQGLELHRALQVLGVPVSFVRYPREGHGIGERHHQIDLMRRIVEWLEKYVG